MTSDLSKTLLIVVLIVAVAAGVGLMLVWVGSQTEQVDTASEFVVAATIFPLADIVRNVAGDQVQVVPVVPPGASPHSYALTPQQVVALQQAQIIFAIGHGLDDAIVESVVAVSEARVVTVDQGIDLRSFAADGTDPHYWLTAANAKQIAATVAEHLQAIDPDQAGRYEQNLVDYMEQLDDLEAELQLQAQSIVQRNFFAMHNSWSYFADHYGLKLVASYEPVEGRQPSLADLTRMGELIKTHAITVFYAEPQKAATAATRFLKEEFGLATRVLDPIGGVGNVQSYIELMQANMRALEAG